MNDIIKSIGGGTENIDNGTGNGCTDGEGFIE